MEITNLCRAEKHQILSLYPFHQSHSYESHILRVGTLVTHAKWKICLTALQFRIGVALLCWRPKLLNARTKISGTTVDWHSSQGIFLLCPYCVKMNSESTVTLTKLLWSQVDEIRLIVNH